MRGYYAATISAVTLLPVFLAVKTVPFKKNGVFDLRRVMREKKIYIIIIPLVLFYAYLIYASAFGAPVVGSATFYRYYVHWYGSAACFIGLIWASSALVAMGADHTRRKLIIGGPFAINRNPMYTGVLFIMAGVYITFTNWIFLAYALGFIYFADRQVKREEVALKKIFGDEYAEYCTRVRRYF